VDREKEVNEAPNQDQKSVAIGLGIVVFGVALIGWFVWGAFHKSCDSATANWQKQAEWARQHPNPASFEDATKAHQEKVDACSTK
jgi:hypothetical protein